MLVWKLQRKLLIFHIYKTNILRYCSFKNIILVYFWGLVRNWRRHYSHFFQNENESLERREALSLIPGWHRVREKGALTYSQVVHSPPPPNFFSATIFARLKRETCFYSTPKVCVSLRHLKILFQRLVQRNDFSSMAFVLQFALDPYKRKVTYYIVLGAASKCCYICTFHLTLEEENFNCK